MIENIIQFSDNSSMLGILTEPASPSSKQPAFIFVNSGLLHRIGPFRIYVSLARELAENGYSSFRIDLSGKGDSEPRKNSATINENVKLDIKEAMDQLQQSHGITHFVICGICTGADNAYEIGFDDKRVVGIVPIDGYAYPNLKFKLRHYLPKLLSTNSWKNLLRKTLRLVNKKDQSLEQSNLTANYRMIFPPADKFLGNLKSAVNDNKQLLVIYTGGWNQFNNYQDQFSDCFPEVSQKPNIEVIYNNASDHTFILRKDKEWLIDKIITWSNKRFQE